MVSAYDQLPRTPANFVALSPLRYLERAAYIYPNQDAIVHGARHISWRDTYTRCRQFAHQLQNLGIQKTIPFLFFYPISLRWSKHILQSLWLALF